jgi:hypothetical protein
MWKQNHETDWVNYQFQQQVSACAGQVQIQGVPNEITITIWLYFDEHSIFFCFFCCTAHSSQ